MVAAWLSWFFRDRRTGELVVAQWPNALLWAFGLTWLASQVATGTLAQGARIASAVFLALWAADELLRGVNPWRRCLGTGVLAWLLVKLFA